MTTELRQTVSPPAAAAVVATEASEATAPGEARFTGTPRRYARLAWILAFATHAYLYAGMVLVEYVWHGRTWVLGWRPIATLTAMMLLFALFCRSQWLQLDARRGMGSRWRLRSTEVKLPEER